MPYVVTNKNVLKPGKFRARATFTIAVGSDPNREMIGQVIVLHYGRGAEKRVFVGQDGQKLSPRTHRRQIRGMDRVAREYDLPKAIEAGKNPWGEINV